MDLCLILLLGLASHINGQAHHLKFLLSPEDNNSCIIIEDTFLPNYRGFDTKGENEFKFSVKSAIKPPADANIELENGSQIIEVFARKHLSATAYMESLCRSHTLLSSLKQDDSTSTADPEIRKIADGGDQANRIDVVFMGDGYAASEKEQFFQDMERLTANMFEGATFRSYLPLFNIWAIYVESVDSGIGYDGPKNTPFRLYRESGELRIIWPGNPQYAREVCTLTGPSGCDYPSLIGNDDYYGGLGGEFVISTKSNRTGVVVMRHEMGHNFVAAGDEYDNSPTYYGVNSANAVASLGWTAWLTNGAREERAMYRMLEYPWTDLSKGAQTFNFTSDGAFSRWYLQVSVSAAGEEDSLEFLLDGEVLPWKTTGFEDREFYSWSGSEGFSSGSHSFSVRSKTTPTHPDIPRMIGSITLHEFGDENEFVEDIDHISAYPTWGVNRLKTFRPSNAGCLMRNMTHDKFCPVCQEGMWAQFLQRVSLIDSVDVGNSTVNGRREVTVNTLKLGQLRAPNNKVEGEKLEIKWFLGQAEQPELRDLFTINAAPGVWTVAVHFVTSEVRHDPRDLLTSTKTVVVPQF